MPAIVSTARLSRPLLLLARIGRKYDRRILRVFVEPVAGVIRIFCGDSMIRRIMHFGAARPQ
jgi:hypothetical protein